MNLKEGKKESELGLSYGENVWMKSRKTFQRFKSLRGREHLLEKGHQIQQFLSKISLRDLHTKQNMVVKVAVISLQAEHHVFKKGIKTSF